jgi:hypothetical protein
MVITIKRAILKGRFLAMEIETESGQVFMYGFNIKRNRGFGLIQQIIDELEMEKMR